MSKSRYENVDYRSIKGKQMITSSDAYINRPIPIERIQTMVITYDGVSRLDQLAHKYLGDSQYFWVIMKLNNLWNFWRISPGSKLVIPVNVQDVLDYF